MIKFEVVCIDDSSIEYVIKGQHYIIVRHEHDIGLGYYYVLCDMKGHELCRFTGLRSTKCFIRLEEWRDQQLNKVLHD